MCSLYTFVFYGRFCICHPPKPENAHLIKPKHLKSKVPDGGLLASANMGVSYTRPPDWPAARPSVPRPALAPVVLSSPTCSSRLRRPFLATGCRLAAGSRAICALTGRGVKDCNITREQRTEKRARQRRAGETHPYMGGDHFDILVENGFSTFWPRPGICT